MINKRESTPYVSITIRKRKEPRRILVYALRVPLENCPIPRNDDIFVILRNDPGEELSQRCNYSPGTYVLALSDTQFRDINGRRTRKKGDRYYADNIADYPGPRRDIEPKLRYNQYLDALVKSNPGSIISYDGLVCQVFDLERRCSEAKKALKVL